MDFDGINHERRSLNEIRDISFAVFSAGRKIAICMSERQDSQFPQLSLPLLRSAFTFRMRSKTYNPAALLVIVPAS